MKSLMLLLLACLFAVPAFAGWQEMDTELSYFDDYDIKHFNKKHFREVAAWIDSEEGLIRIRVSIENANGAMSFYIAAYDIGGNYLTHFQTVNFYDLGLDNDVEDCYLVFGFPTHIAAYTRHIRVGLTYH